MQHARHLVQLVLVLLAAVCLPACRAGRSAPEPARVAGAALRPEDQRSSQAPRERFFFNEKSREIEESLGL